MGNRFQVWILLFKRSGARPTLKYVLEARRPSWENVYERNTKGVCSGETVCWDVGAAVPPNGELPSSLWKIFKTHMQGLSKSRYLVAQS